MNEFWKQATQLCYPNATVVIFGETQKQLQDHIDYIKFGIENEKLDNKCIKCNLKL